MFMQPSSWSTDTAVSSVQSRSGVSPLAGRWLLLARLVWWSVALLVVVLFITALPTSFAHLQTLCLGASCNGPQLTSQQASQLQIVGLSLPFYAAYFITLNSVFFVAYFAVACVLFWQRADDRTAFIGSLFLVSFGGATFPGTLDALAALTPTWGLLVAIARFLGFVFLSLFIYLFPDGHFVPSWIRFVALVGLLVQVPDTLFPGSPLSFSHLPRLLVFVLFLASLVCPVAVQIYRYRRMSNVVQRQQTKWVVFGLTAAIVGFLGLLLLTAIVSPTEKNTSLASLIVVSAYYLFFLLIPLTMSFAILRYKLWDIDLIINRTLVYGILSVSIIGLYALIVVSLGALLRTPGNLLISLLATGLIAVLFQPLRFRLQQGVNRLMFGERDSPYQVISHLGQRLEATLAPDAVLPTITETVAQALKLPYVAITFKQDDEFPLAASYGKPAATPLMLPLVYQTETIGQLLLAPRARGESFTPADHRLLTDLARQAGIAAHVVRLTSDLQRSRERIVTAREEERRRLRRDLHDGLGPTLAALNLQTGAVRALILQNPAEASAMVMEWRTTLRGVITDIRRLVYELRPPALDELGLLGAIREQAAQYSRHPETHSLQMVVEAPDSLPPLSAAVEVATYRIAQEALANVVRHAQARTCSVRLWLDDTLHLSITDDGVGLPEEHHAGVGMISMRERAGELGGVCRIEPVSTRGVCVSAQFPFSKE
jgi:signal transduction histidine kinase